MRITNQKRTFNGELVISLIAADSLIPHLIPECAAMIEKISKNIGTI